MVRFRSRVSGLKGIMVQDLGCRARDEKFLWALGADNLRGLLKVADSWGACAVERAKERNRERERANFKFTADR